MMRFFAVFLHPTIKVDVACRAHSEAVKELIDHIEEAREARDSIKDQAVEMIARKTQ